MADDSPVKLMWEWFKEEAHLLRIDIDQNSMLYKIYSFLRSFVPAGAGGGDIAAANKQLAENLATTGTMQGTKPSDRIPSWLETIMGPKTFLQFGESRLNAILKPPPMFKESDLPPELRPSRPRPAAGRLRLGDISGQVGTDVMRGFAGMDELSGARAMASTRGDELLVTERDSNKTLMDIRNILQRMEEGTGIGVGGGASGGGVGPFGGGAGGGASYPTGQGRRSILERGGGGWAGQEDPGTPTGIGGENRSRGGVPQQMAGVDPKLKSWVEEGAKYGLPPGYTFKWVSGREARRRGGYHPMGGAADLQIYDPKGNPLPNIGRGAPQQLYDRLGLAIRAAQERLDPDDPRGYTYGGHFRSGTPYDFMHQQRGGPSAVRFSREAVEREKARQSHIAGGGTPETVPRPAAPQAPTGEIRTPPGAAPGYVATRREVTDYIARAATARGIDPNIALRVYGHEGNLQWRSTVPGEHSYGPFQLNVRGEGANFRKATGLDPSDPRTWKQNIDFALDTAIKKGWGPWMGARAVGITGRMGISRDARVLGVTPFNQQRDTRASPTQENIAGERTPPSYRLPPSKYDYLIRQQQQRDIDQALARGSGAGADPNRQIGKVQADIYVHGAAKAKVNGNGVFENSVTLRRSPQGALSGGEGTTGQWNYEE